MSLQSYEWKPHTLRIAYVGTFQFPEGDASAARVLGNAMAMRELGHTVVFFGIEKSQLLQSNSAVGREGNLAEYQGFHYRTSAPAGTDIIGKMLRQFSILTGSSILDRLKAEEMDSGSFDAIVAYQPPSLLLMRLLQLCRARHIPLIGDIVEWYDARQLALGRLGPFFLDSEIRMRCLLKKTDGVIAISNFLNDYLKKSGMPTHRVPPLVDVAADKWILCLPLHENEKLRLSFVGNAGQKDFLVNAIRGLALLGDRSKGCEIEMVGPTREEVRSSLGPDAGLLDTLNDSLLFSGRLPHREALQRLAQADFSILLRPDARFAHAGFPTKLVESLTMGVPVICNLTSDIGLYVRDGHEGIVVKDCSPEAFVEGIRRALVLSSEERTSMRRSAKKCADQSFDYRKWTKPLGAFMSNVVEKSNQRKIR